MNRREFLRRSIISATMGIAALAGVFAIAETLVNKNPSGAPNLLIQSSTQQSLTTSKSSTQTQQQIGGNTTSSTTSSTSSSSPSTSNPPSGYVFLAPLSALNGKTYAYFNHPNFGNSILINYNGIWKAFSAKCTHQVCTLDYGPSTINCPCHSATFSPVDGSVLSGPPPTGLPQYDIKVVNNDLYVSVHQQ